MDLKDVAEAQDCKEVEMCTDCREVENADSESLMQSNGAADVIAPLSEDNDSAHLAMVNKAFRAFIVNAWRNRRLEVKPLKDELHNSKEASIKYQVKLRCLHLVYRNKRKSHDRLTWQLKCALDNKTITRAAYEELKHKLIPMEAANAALLKQLDGRQQELNTLTEIFAQSKSELFRSMRIQRELLQSLSVEQRMVQSLENQKLDFASKIVAIKQDVADLNEAYCTIIESKDMELAEAKASVERYDYMLQRVEKLDDEVHEHALSVIDNKKSIETLQYELQTLQNYLNVNAGSKLKSFYNIYGMKTTLKVLQFIAWLIDPSEPRPKIRFHYCLSFFTALSRFIKR